MPKVTLTGVAVWIVALVVILAVPSLHEGARDWWPWAPVCGIVLGLLGFGAGTRYLWTLPMFHCNGWCFPWTISIVAGTHEDTQPVSSRGGNSNDFRRMR